MMIVSEHSIASMPLATPRFPARGLPRASASEPAREADLIARLRRGDEAAYEELVRLYGGQALAVARRMLRNEEEAQDAVQDAFLQVFRALARFRGDSKLSTWLHRIVVNAALMKLRSRRQEPEQSIDELLPQFVEDGSWMEPVADWREPAERALERGQTRQLVRACIDRLPESYRTVLMLRDIEELDTEEVASALGISSNAVKIRLHRARQALRTLLAEHFEQPRA